MDRKALISGFVGGYFGQTMKRAGAVRESNSATNHSLVRCLHHFIGSNSSESLTYLSHVTTDSGLGNAQGSFRPRTNDTIGLQALPPLQLLHCGLGFHAEDTVHNE